jgi:hypothetical protein
MPHEFLFLLINSQKRHKELRRQAAPDLQIGRMAIDEYDQSEVNGIRLDYLYQLETDAWESWYTNPIVGKRAVAELDKDAQEKKSIFVADLANDNIKGARSLWDDTVKACAKIPKKQKMVHIEDPVSELSSSATPLH